MDHSVVVIGGGSAGLTAAVALQRKGIRPLVVERGPQVGMSWRRRHTELRLNTVRWLSGADGPRIPRSAGRWVGRDDYVRYLDDYAARNRLDIMFETHIERLERTANHWQLQLSEGVLTAGHVVVATGHDRVPTIPEWPGMQDFGGRLTHVAGVRSAADFAGQRVLLAGAGNSGVEIAGHLAEAGVTDLWVSVRTPPNILPREILGLPTHPATVAFQFLPECMRDTMARRIAHAAFGDLGPFGLPTPQQGPFERMRTTGVTAAVDQGFVKHVKTGRIQIVSEIERLGQQTAVLRDGRTLEVDAVIAATGFRPGLAELVGHLGVLDPSGLPVPSLAEPLGLWFSGFHPAIEGNLRQHPGEARRIARTIARISKTPADDYREERAILR